MTFREFDALCSRLRPPSKESEQAEVLKIDPLYRIRKYDALAERMKQKG